ncbi:lytic murein transglycosylase [Cellulomonas sp. NPDC057328]|uniref:lytic murein transglycosylase n=1 Tax=Cellulomonas sp. NPDC057328 TaxID=3346101 RepID=UPI003637A28E
MSGRALLPVAAGGLAVLGAAALVAAVTIPPSNGAAPSPSTSSGPRSTPSAPARTPAPVPTATVHAAHLPLPERADADWVARTARAAGVPPRALAAYAGAALAVADTHPTCGLGWNTLAAIGEVESAHGTLQGGAVGADGRVQPRVVGVPLDGSPGVAAIRDTDGGVLDGDTAWDRAVGPMQFLPGTWAEHAQDGDRDGASDVDDLDDAALAAAVYLCDAGGDLTDPAGWIAAVHAYNPSAEYNARVAGAAERLAALP